MIANVSLLAVQPVKSARLTPPPAHPDDLGRREQQTQTLDQGDHRGQEVGRSLSSRGHQSAGGWVGRADWTRDVCSCGNVDSPGGVCCRATWSTPLGRAPPWERQG